MTDGNTPLAGGQKFQVGICFYGATGTGESSCPDCNGAVNDTYFVEFINGSFAAYNTATGEAAVRVTDREFWEGAGLSPDAPLVDPRIVFIPGAGRNGQWLAVQLLNMGQAVYVATTDPNDPKADPTGKWRASQFALPGADFPMLGYDANGIYIGSNTDAGEKDRQPQIVTISRAKALAYPPQLDGIKITKPLPIADYGANLYPVINGGGGAPAGIAIGVDTASKKHLTYAYISPTSGEITTHGRIEVEPFEPIPFGFGIKQPYPGNPLPGSISDVRFFGNGSGSAPIGDGSNIWMTHTVMKPDRPPAIGTLAVRWYRLSIDQNSGLPTLAAWGEVSQPHYDYFNSSILPFGKDDYAVLSLSRSGDSSTPTDPDNDGCGNIGAYAALVREKPGGQSQFQLAPLASGLADKFTPGIYTKRWGDFTTICKDPKRPRGVWTINQFVLQGGDSSQTSEWRTAIGGFIIPPV